MGIIKSKWNNTQGGFGVISAERRVGSPWAGWLCTMPHRVSDHRLARTRGQGD